MTPQTSLERELAKNTSGESSGGPAMVRQRHIINFLYFVMNKNYETPHYAAFSRQLPLLYS
jgi:hypothetical protein